MIGRGLGPGGKLAGIPVTRLKETAVNRLEQFADPAIEKHPFSLDTI